jgi:serine/threonine-protein kinase RsbW
VRDRGRIETISIRSDPGMIRVARKWLAGILHEADWSGREVHDLAVALSEACANAHRYAYEGRTDGKIELRLEMRPHEIEIAVRDYGRGFDPSMHGRPDLSTPREGGYGIHLMKELTDRLEYRSSRAGTVVVMVKSKRAAESGNDAEPPGGRGGGIRHVG